MTQTRRAARSVVAVLALLGLLTVASCSEPAKGEPSSVSVRMTVNDGGRLTLGKAMVEVPAGALTSDAMVTIVRLDLAVPDGMGPAFAFHLDPAQQPRVPLVLHLPGPEGAPDDTQPMYLAYRDESGRWTNIPANREAGGTVRASVTHLSDWRSLDLFGWLTGIWHTVAQHLEGPLAPPAACPGAIPTAAVQGLPGNAPLSMCVRQGTAGHVTVTVTNRRHFALSLTPSANLTPPPLLLGPTGRVVLPSEGHVDFDFVPNQQQATLAYQPDAAYTALEQLWPAILGGGLGLDTEGIAALLKSNDLIRCTARNSATADLAAGVRISVDCLVAAVQHKSGLFEAISTILKHLPFGAVSAMLAVDATGRVALSVATTLPDVGGSGATTPATTPSSPRSTPTQPPPPTVDTHAPPATDPGQNPLPGGYTNLGGVDLERYCQTGWGMHAVLRYPTTWGWQCAPTASPHAGWQPGDQNISVDDACAQQHGPGALSHYTRYTDPYSWFCWRS